MRQTFILVDKFNQNFKGFSFNGISGIIGLGKTNTLVALVFEGLDFLDTNHFAIELGSKKFHKKSYLYYNLSETDFPNANYFPCLPFDPFWSITVS